jgi:hypothetical protein
VINKIDLANQNARLNREISDSKFSRLINQAIISATDNAKRWASGVL